MGEQWYQEKLRKVHKYDAEFMSENEGHRISGDYMSGRKVFPFSSGYAEWRSDPKNRLDATERILVADCLRRGYPIADRCKKYQVATHSNKLCVPVYFNNGRRVLCGTFSEAVKILTENQNAVKIWDNANKRYVYKTGE